MEFYVKLLKIGTALSGTGLIKRSRIVTGPP